MQYDGAPPSSPRLQPQPAIAHPGAVRSVGSVGLSARRRISRDHRPRSRHHKLATSGDSGPSSSSSAAALPGGSARLGVYENFVASSSDASGATPAWHAGATHRGVRGSGRALDDSRRCALVSSKAVQEVRVSARLGVGAARAADGREHALATMQRLRGERHAVWASRSCDLARSRAHLARISASSLAPSATAARAPAAAAPPIQAEARHGRQPHRHHQQGDHPVH